VTMNDLGFVTSVNSLTSTITVSTAATSAFSAASPTYVRMSLLPIRYYKFSDAGRVQMGTSKVGGSHLPTNTIVRLTYTNNGSETHTFLPSVEYLY
jgi:hypothetical protein